MIHQEISLIPPSPCPTNVWIGREGSFSNFRGVYNRRRQRQATRKILDQLGLKINPDAEVSRLSVAEMADGGDRPRRFLRFGHRHHGRADLRPYQR